MKSTRPRHYHGSFASFPWGLVGTVPLLMLGGMVAMKVPASFLEGPGSAMATLVFACFAGLMLLSSFSSSGWNASPSALVIHRLLGSRHILYRNIFRVDRVRRVARSSTGGVRITFRRGGQTQTLKLTSECPEELVCDILQHCPHLSRAKTMTLLRDRSLKALRSPFLGEAGKAGDVW